MTDSGRGETVAGTLMMSFEKRRPTALDYQPVTYPGSVLRFRGPTADIGQPHVLCLGGTETFGRFVSSPYPDRLASRLGVPVTNMGISNAGLDVLKDPAIRAATRTARAIVLQLPGAANMSNRFYTVHPRRNDRFLKAGSVLRTIYGDVDFTEFHFTRHLLSHLVALSSQRFSILRQELQTAWCARMKTFLADAPAPVHLLWLSCRLPAMDDQAATIGAEPLFVTRDMLDDIGAGAASLSIVSGIGADDARSSCGMLFAEGDALAACSLPGPQAHEDACAALVPHLSGTAGQVRANRQM